MQQCYLKTDSDYLHLRMGDSKATQQQGVFASTTFEKDEIVCEVRGKVVKVQNLNNVRLKWTDRLAKISEGSYLYVTNLTRQVQDLIVKPASVDDYNHYQSHGYQYIEGKSYNASIRPVQNTPNRRIQQGQQILVRYDLAMWRQIFRCRFMSPYSDFS